MDKCAEFNLPYNNYSTIIGAIASHFRVMKMLGKQPSVVETVQAQAA